MPADLVLVLPFILLGAMLYTSVGHGGATIYLAVLTLAGFAVGELVTTVLVLNVIAAGIAFVMFRQAGHLRLDLLLPFALASVPMAFVGGLYPFAGRTQELLLGAALAAAAARFLLVSTPPRFVVPREGHLMRWGAPLMGAVLGFLAGATGIGGGIFLSPVLLAFGWATIHQTGSIASAFIVLNSLAGLAARLPRSPVDLDLVVPLAVAAIVGAVAGSFVGAKRLPARGLRVMLGLVLLVAAARTLL